MKMAKASPEDLDMALDLISVLDDIERGFFPHRFSDPDSEMSEWLDFTNREQYGRLIDNLRRLLNRGSIGRVIMGMAVVCDPSNECIDPDADCIEHHPKRQRLEKQVEDLINKLDRHQKDAAIGRAVNRASGELPFGYDLHIELEKDAGTVRLYRPDGEEVDEEFHDCDYFSGAIDNAINVAIADAEKGGAA
ncbi:MAG: hypothetical protein BWY57_03097 [Betaproteobacteria bacterium ADurb.Bin341]|nr:MAG: hypothetical protein BWY57_03097 [Betaproteobacteria bacterium ADurb.Bin341]